ncbi:MAG TPA: helix-turn-helix transcriptional regulator, partial [Baekduia sp.]|nr:helix-turn-helix transcriptional regulator [Baekduia sp.]
TTRERHEVSQRQLARRAGTSQAAISHIESGRVSPTVATLEKLLLCLGERLELEACPLPGWQDDQHAAARAPDGLTSAARISRQLSELAASRR